MRVLIVEPMKAPYEKEIEEGLESLQHEVGGYIEAVYPFEDPVAVICNEEGKYNGMTLNRALRDENGEIYDVLAGQFIIAGLGEESFDSLSEELIEKYKKVFHMPETFIMADGKVVAIPVDDQPEESTPEKSKERYCLDRSALLKGALTNLGEYNEGMLDYIWISFPISDGDLEKAFKEIGIDGERYEEYFITDYDCDVSHVYDHLGEYTSIRDLNALAERLEEMTSHEVEHFEAIMESDGASDVADMINITYNLDSWDFLPGINNDSDLGYYWIEESGCYDTGSLGNLSSYIDYEGFGRDVRLDEGGTFVNGGYIYSNGNGINEMYDPVHGYDDPPLEIDTAWHGEER